ncbi:hypothetical protein EDD85DRAFT_145383 [Armillaria nabsnona]|nr:hypothetical protein EDD85DRAFT_145383 [Armillaria nabsnona]
MKDITHFIAGTTRMDVLVFILSCLSSYVGARTGEVVTRLGRHHGNEPDKQTFRIERRSLVSRAFLFYHELNHILRIVRIIHYASIFYSLLDQDNIGPALTSSIQTCSKTFVRRAVRSFCQGLTHETE